MCGEHWENATRAAQSVGSSPHVRGTHVALDENDVAHGIIPACAGNTRYCPTRRNQPRDHPRMCGEHWYTAQLKYTCLGSSPHVRGTRRSRFQPWCRSGIIPACAGNTNHCKARLGYSGDHPRMCGEHKLLTGFMALVTGSSPNVRGTQCSCIQNRLQSGIIPACAGNTSRNRNSTRYARDHPRMCGEHIGPHSAPFREWGSSPHVRGTLLRAVI